MHAPASRGFLRTLIVLRIAGKNIVATLWRDCDIPRPPDWGLGYVVQ